ncbi:SGNH/GDSL hydrolase family protein [Pedobacter cryophilus]|uniref:SGNH/GDSL hydrolase family protein n=1 Tax=Pedobacter cryophilus TaxID=2571271 RepID=A0A4U1C998_9SPHI|nr:SGNH/GDSL hydrolase family protein [Pedobacter cryophilus]TKC00987.1 SGNH/GDSL hydrolase family protein [Pedobacter cryophilus]
MKSLLIVLLSATIGSGCAKKDNEAQNPNNATFKPISSVKTYTYLALGDSYTIGEAVMQNESFPYQLAQVLKTDSSAVEEPKIIAKTGWTTDELIQNIKATPLNPKYDFVTLLIGVNNQYRNYDIEIYRKEFAALLQTAINYAGGKPERVFVISIPDWGVTTFAKNSGRSITQIAKEIDAYNAINKEETGKMQANYLDITPISREAATNISLIASDGLHPSAQMYMRWVEKLKPLVALKLN